MSKYLNIMNQHLLNIFYPSRSEIGITFHLQIPHRMSWQEGLLVVLTHTHAGSWQKAFIFNLHVASFNITGSLCVLDVCKIFNLLCKHYGKIFVYYAWRKLFLSLPKPFLWKSLWRDIFFQHKQIGIFLYETRGRKNIFYGHQFRLSKWFWSVIKLYDITPS